MIEDQLLRESLRNRINHHLELNPAFIDRVFKHCCLMMHPDIHPSFDNAHVWVFQDSKNRVMVIDLFTDRLFHEYRQYLHLFCERVRVNTGITAIRFMVKGKLYSALHHVPTFGKWYPQSTVNA